MTGAPIRDHPQQLAWWRLRSWKKDLEVLSRVRDGLRALPDDPEMPDVTDRPDAAAGAPAAPYPLAVRQPGRTLAADPSGVPQPRSAAGAAAPRGHDAEDRPATAADLPGPDPADLDQAAPEQAQDPAAPDPVSPGTDPVSPDPALVAIRYTFDLVASAGDKAAGYFYASLFSSRPELRDLFPPAMDEQRDRLFGALSRIVESLSTPAEMVAYLTQLGRDHRKYSVQAPMYEAVGQALIATLRHFAGPEFTPAAEEAWTEAYQAASGLMIRAAEEDSAASPAFWAAEVVETEHRARGIAVVTLAPEPALDYEAGQHVSVQTARWPRVWRPYSIACRPREDGLIRLHVKAVPGGWVSNALVRHTGPGDQVILGPPLGTMTLAPAAGRDLLCVAGGTGLSPVKAIVEQAIREAAAGRGRQILLFYGARTREELYDLRDLWRLVDSYPGFQLTPVTSDDPAFDGMQGSVGRVAARYMPHRDFEAYVAGPPLMVRESIRVLVKAGLPRERIHYDDALLADRKRVGTGT